MNKILLLMVCAFALNGCIKLSDVKPWQKATHAKQTMQDGGINPLKLKFDTHIYYSKEATKGGYGVAGGGCGCN